MRAFAIAVHKSGDFPSHFFLASKRLLREIKANEKCKLGKRTTLLVFSVKSFSRREETAEIFLKDKNNHLITQENMLLLVSLPLSIFSLETSPASFDVESGIFTS